ncbi:hypothetical protein [Paludisphaera sp.]|uniref:hypothetical protein n=1 Tax=Paludisphaera sp. TaxID=2017432 RepID=UPI00301C3EDF
MNEDLRYDAALAAALFILNEVPLDGCKATALSTLTFIILEAIYQAQRSVGEPSAN